MVELWLADIRFNLKEINDVVGGNADTNKFTIFLDRCKDQQQYRSFQE